MREILEKLSKVTAPVCVTLILHTHKTHPENSKDRLLLKNMIVEASNRLQNEYGKEIAKNYTKKLQKISDDINHNYNDHGLLLFVNDNIAEFLRVPVSPHSDRVIIDTTFATRTIIRALSKDTDYYVLALTKQKARLLEASSDALIQEFNEGGFPVTDNDLQPSTRPEAAKSFRMTNLTQEFFNRIDKQVNQIRNRNPLPVVVYSEEINYNQYLKVADSPNTILGHVLLKNFDEKSANLVKEIWPFIKDLTIKNNRARITELEQALGTGHYLVDLNDIWRAVQNGRGKTIFVEEGYYQPVKIENDILTPISSGEITHPPDNNDIVDDMIEQNLKHGGDVVFLAKGQLEKFQKIALVTRF